MSFDPGTNTIYVQKGKPILKDMGQFFLKTMMQDSLLINAPDQIKNDSIVIRKWLGHINGDLTQDHYNKFGEAWQSYVAKGEAPSKGLDESFKSFANQAIKENWKLVEVPEELKQVFGRMLATDVQIKTKENLNYPPTVDKNSHKDKGLDFISYFENMNKMVRLFLSLSVIWIAYVTFRTSDYYEMFGISLDKWDNDYQGLNTFAPIIACVVGNLIIKWIRAGK